jgi:putative transport protein
VIVGKESPANLLEVPGHIINRRVVVTHKEVLGQTLRELALDHVYGVTATRLTRADLEITVSADLKLQFGDMLQLVGTEEALEKAAALLGNSVQELNHTRLIPMFLGIALGVLVGSYPLHFTSMPAPVRLGLAGGPLVVAIALSRIGRIGPLLWYVPANANVLLREFGIALFLSCVGLRSGANFLDTLLRGDGFLWMGAGCVITLVPLLLAAWIARRLMKMNFLNLCGLLAGSMTDPPALAFANTVSSTDAPSVAYATVYPMTMLLRIVVAQLLVLLFCG